MQTHHRYLQILHGYTLKFLNTPAYAYNAICEYLDYQRPIGNRTETFGESEDGEVRDERYYNSLVSASRYGGVRIRNNTMEYLSERLTEYEGYIQSGV